MLYADTDVLFTFGDEKFSKEKFSWLGGNIKQSFPVGSSKMESLFYQNKKKLNNKTNVLYQSLSKYDYKQNLEKYWNVIKKHI